MKNTVITAERVRELLDFDPATGVPTNRVSRHRARAGMVTGGTNGHGYRHCTIDNRLYLAHRLAWLAHYGRWPVGEIDHINGIRDDNRIANLRECSRGENQQNLSAKTVSRSGLRGAHWAPRQKKWVAQIRLNGKLHHLGYHHTLEAAHAAYLEAKQRLHTFNPIPRTNTLEMTP